MNIKNFLSIFFVLSLISANVISEEINNNINFNKKEFRLKLGTSRIIYNSDDKKGTSFTIYNEQNYPILAQTYVLDENREKKNNNFILTPPLVKLDANQQSRIRIIDTDYNKSKKIETLNWLCVLGVPPKEADDWVDDKTKETLDKANIDFQVSVTNCIKLLTRPTSLKQPSENFANHLQWKVENDKIKVINPSPYYINFDSIYINDKQVNYAGYIPPLSYKEYPIINKSNVYDIKWSVITDFGGITEKYIQSIR
ncbi:molecular chaperone [Proteus mirabilis]|uniref:fimbrial biogenesis chaperone n=1 Tax=Proteus mirabilis TaxID=584 RepID=UPI0023F9CEDE|nr:molecular chaperone [Proteus mirabilis]MDF7238956.1 molecular chaperone [Proteus mirabilis]